MPIAANRACLFCFVLLASAGVVAVRAERQRPPGILRGLIGELVPGSPHEIEERASQARDGAEALRLYGSLQSRFGASPEGVRAALWVGIYFYGAGEEESSLEYFERARHYARDPELVARAEFWCDQVRLRTGREPLPSEEGRGRGGFRALQALVRVDRSIREGRRSEAEAELLSIEGEIRRAGLLGPYMARWGDLLRMPGSGRVNRTVLDPFIEAGAGLPERLRLAVPAPAASPASQEEWSLQFGAFLDQENATAQVHEFQRKGLELRIDEATDDGRAWFRTRFGKFTSHAAAESTAAGLGLPAGTPHDIVRLQ
jgi:hypothetical protein